MPGPDGQADDGHAQQDRAGPRPHDSSSTAQARRPWPTPKYGVDDGTTMAQLGLSKAPARPVMAAVGAPPTVVIAKNDDTERANAAAFRALLDNVNERDSSKAFGDALPADYKAVDVVAPKDDDKAGALASLNGFIAGFPDMALSANTVWAAGDYVVVAGHFTGTDKGIRSPAMGSTKPTRTSPVDVRYIEVLSSSRTER